MADKRRFRGPGGGLFVPCPAVDEDTIKQHVASGDWTPVEDKSESKSAPAKSKRSSSSKPKQD